jgi:pantetheine-phosphate adenylyltransferase
LPARRRVGCEGGAVVRGLRRRLQPARRGGDPIDHDPHGGIELTRIAICPGTYDPVTLGHLDVIERASTLFDAVVVGVVRAPRHKATMFTIEQRIAFLEESLGATANVSVRPFSNLVVEFAREVGAGALVKGLRAVSDFEWEFQMNHLNKRLAPEIETVYLMSSSRYSFVSSSGVREIAEFGGSVAGLVPEPVVRAFTDRYAARS